eukprot:41551_1
MATKTDQKSERKLNHVFEKVACALMCVILVFIAGTWYHDASSKSTNSQSHVWYSVFIDLSTFALVGFGFSMTYLRKYGFTALSMTLLTVSICIPLGLTASQAMSFVFAWINNDGFIAGPFISRGLFSSITVLITLGVVLGRINPSQLLCIAFLEIIFWTVNMHINEVVWGLHDAGSAINIHAFATYFGLAISWMIEPALNDLNKKSMYTSDLFSFIGTLFLWLYWPSFNAYHATPEYHFQDRAIVNTVFSLCGSTFAAFFMSLALSKTHRFDITHIQQSTLAGGVAIGSVADLYVHPVGAISIGIVSGIISVLGYVYVSDLMEECFKIADTRGIHNIHGMPAILSACAAAIALAMADVFGGIYVDSEHPDYPFVWPDLQQQAQYTMVALCTTLLIAIFGGAVTGWIVVLFSFPNDEFCDSDNFKVFFAIGGTDPFRETIRGHHFAGRRSSATGLYSLVSAGRQDTLLDGDFDWRDELDASHPQNVGIQVVDTMRMTHGMDLNEAEWRRYIELDMMPSRKSISYANILRDYYFDDDNKEDVEDDEMFYPSFCTAKVLKQSFDEDDGVTSKGEDEYEYYMTAKLNSNVDPSSFKRKHLNLVIVLDTAGAICADFEYDDNEEGNKNMKLANMIIGMMNSHLTRCDRVGVVALSDKVQVLQTLKFVHEVDVDILKRQIVFLTDGAVDSDTTSYDAYKTGLGLFEKASIGYSEAYENRVIFITVGISGDEKDESTDGEDCANDENMRIYTTMIGIGIGFTSEMDKRSRFRGLNMVNVQKTSELKQYFEEEEKFTFLVTPIFYNVNLKLKCMQNSCQIDTIYGARNARYKKYVRKRGNIMKIHTIFASDESIQIVQSGVLLIKLKRLNKDTMNAMITVSYEDRNESEYFNPKSITFKEEAYCDTNSIRKSILLCQYTQILMNWLENTTNDGSLVVSQKHKQIFKRFSKYFETEMTKCNDQTLQKELDVLRKLVE